MLQTLSSMNKISHINSRFALLPLIFFIYAVNKDNPVVTTVEKTSFQSINNYWPSFEIYPASNWNYGLLQGEVNNASMLEVVKKQWPADDFPFTQQAVPLEIKAKGKQIPTWRVDKYGLCDTLPQSPVAVNTNTEVITLIPMGAARLRISAFPVVQNNN